MHEFGATTKRTALPTAGVRAGCVRTRSLMSLQRIITSAELPRNVTRSTTPAPWFGELSADGCLVEKLDGFRTKEQLRSHSRLPFYAALRDKSANRCRDHHLIPRLAAIAFDLRRNKIRCAQESPPSHDAPDADKGPTASRLRSMRPHA